MGKIPLFIYILGMSSTFGKIFSVTTWGESHGPAVRDYRGGGRSSARETIGRVAAGVVARKFLSQVAGTEFVSWVQSVGEVECLSVDLDTLNHDMVEASRVRCPDAAASANAFAMSFDDESTGITDIDDSQAHDVRFNSNGIYTLDGRRTEGQPTAKGIYIQNGRKVIIK